MQGGTYIGVELADEAGEVVVLKVIWEQVAGELRWSPHHEGGLVLTPRHNLIGGWVIHQMVGLGQERCRDTPMAIVCQQAPPLICTGRLERQRHT